MGGDDVIIISKDKRREKTRKVKHVRLLSSIRKEHRRLLKHAGIQGLSHH